MVHGITGPRARAFGEKTQPEIGDVAASEGSLCVVPIGSIEQHGLHLPVATDTILVEAIVHESVNRLADDLPVLVAPPIWPGYSPHHVEFGGTLTVAFETLLQLVEDIASSAVEAGFDAVVLVNGHGGNASLVDVAVSTLGVDHPDVEVAGLTYFRLADPFVDEIRESDPGGIGHAGEFETSLMLHLHPELVREEAFHSTYREEPYDHAGREMFDSGPLSTYRPFEEYSDTGEIGDPELASPEKGAELFDRLSTELRRVLEQVHAESAS